MLTGNDITVTVSRRGSDDWLSVTVHEGPSCLLSVECHRRELSEVLKLVTGTVLTVVVGK